MFRTVNTKILFPACLCMAAIDAFIDWNTNLSSAVGILYYPLILCGLWMERRCTAFFFGVVCTILIFSVPLIKSNDIPYDVLLERLYAISGLWVVTLMVCLYRRSEGKQQTAAEKFKETERKFEILLQNLPGMAYRCLNNKEWTMEFLSDSAHKITGHPKEYFLGDNGVPFSDIIAEEFRDPVWDAVQKAIKQKKPFELTYRIETASGEHKWVWEQGVGIFSRSGKLLALEGYIVDITKRILAEENLQEAVNKLTKSNTELERYAYMASHDLREPLRTISSYTQLINKKYADSFDDKGREFTKYILNATDNMRAMIESLLEYSKQDTHINIERVDCEVVLKYVLDNLQSLIQNNKAIVTYDNMPEVLGDEVQIMQIMQNLIINSIKYSCTTNTKVHVYANKTDKEWLFSIQDNGIGIAPEYHETIFLLQKRLHPKKRSGSGIGLAICKKAVENHGGRIWVESESGTGATFHFTIPIYEDQLGSNYV